MQRLLTWIDDRFPLTKLWEEQWGKYVAPKNFNFWYYFGSLAAFVLVLQIVTGIFLAMTYKPDATKAFESIEYMMRDVSGGWFIRYMHSTGASAQVRIRHEDRDRRTHEVRLGNRETRRTCKSS